MNNNTLRPRILVCGGRDYTDRYRLFGVLDDICTDRGWNSPKDEYGNCLPEVVIISGKARGADTLAIDWAIVNWTGLEEYPADWDKYGKVQATFAINRCLTKVNLILLQLSQEGEALIT